MYYLLLCQTPYGFERSILSYDPAATADGMTRGWKSGKRFLEPPAEPILIEIEEELSGLLLEYYDAAIPVMSHRLAEALTAAGVSNIDYYEAEMHDWKTDEIHRSHVVFNLIGAIAAADLSKSAYRAREARPRAEHRLLWRLSPDASSQGLGPWGAEAWSMLHRAARKDPSCLNKESLLNRIYG